MINIKVVKKLGITAGPFLLLLLALGFAWASDSDLFTHIRLFDRIAVTVSDRYVASLDSEKLIDAGIDGMLDALDPYCQYLSDQEYYDLLKETQGEYVGIGVDITMHSDTMWISDIIDGSPAFESNLRIGDRIVKVDGINAVGEDEDICLDNLRGEIGSKLILTIWRPLLNKTLDLKINREKIVVRSIPYWCIDDAGNGYIKINRFSDGCSIELKSIITLLQSKSINGLILDLQGNPGGLLSEAVETAGIFLNKGDKIVETRGRNSVIQRSYEAVLDGDYSTDPLVILVDDQTASAAEIVAGAVQDHDRGLIIGTASFGKGLVQQILQFSDNSALKLTTAKYYTPSQRCLHKDTITSDLVYAEAGADNVLYFTDSGRAVFGGGGIIPDIYIEKELNTPLVDELITLGLATDFVASMSSKLNIDENFNVSDELIDKFLSYVDSKDFDYKIPDYYTFINFIDENSQLVKSGKVNQHTKAISDLLEKRSQAEIEIQRQNIKDHLYESFIRLGLGERKVCELIWFHKRAEFVEARRILSQPGLYVDRLAAN